MGVKKIERLLDSIKFPVNITRENVKQKKDTKVLGMAVGVVQIRFRSETQLSRYTHENPELVRQLVEFAKEKIPGFKFTTIQINKNNQTALHVDRNNLGPSAMIGLGDYQGGQVWIADKGVTSCKNKFCFFDGNEPHGTLPFRGTRYTLVYFTQQRYPYLEKSHRGLARCIGFPMPPTGKRAPVKKKYSPRRVRMDEARPEFEDVVQKYRARLRRPQAR
jgi:hypothetical protein